MNKLSTNELTKIKTWMYRNARPIEQSIWKYCFEDGNKNSVLELLSLYQNDDGGFGNALEADLWNPNSSPYATLCAINILKKIKFSDPSHNIIKGIITYLESGDNCTDLGWSFSIPTNNNYAHAPWWSYNEHENKIQNIGLTAELCAFIFNNCSESLTLYDKALDFSTKLFNKLGKLNNYGEMGINGYIVLFESVNKKNIISNLESVETILSKLINESIEYDFSKWESYTTRPSKYIRSAKNIFYKGNEDIINTELDYIISNRNTQGVWDITWSWFDNNEKYPKEFAISENWWKASIVIENILLLKSFNRV